jgi:hypothetical protein
MTASGIAEIKKTANATPIFLGIDLGAFCTAKISEPALRCDLLRTDQMQFARKRQRKTPVNKALMSSKSHTPVIRTGFSSHAADFLQMKGIIAYIRMFA